MPWLLALALLTILACGSTGVVVGDDRPPDGAAGSSAEGGGGTGGTGGSGGE